MAVAVVCIPILIRELGKDRFGVLTLAWTLIGYASLFDFGLGRALTQLVSCKLGTGDEHEIPSLVWTSILLMGFLGVVVAACVFLISPWMTSHGLNIPVGLRSETQSSFRWLGISIPFVITTTGLRGLLEAHQRFGLINALRIPMGIFTFAGPLIVLPFSKSVLPVVGVLVAGRVLAWAGHLVLCVRVAPELGHSILWEQATLGPLMRFGGWMTVSNVIAPLMVTIDRFLIGALLSLTAVAYYATPYEVVTKFLLIPAALMGVMFPAFSSSFVQDHKRTASLFLSSLKTLSLVLFPFTLCAVVLAQDGLSLWLGAEFAQHSYRVLQILAIGVFINSLAHVPFAFMQGVGRPDITASLHLIQLLPYVGLLLWLIRVHGIEGAAIAWTVRVAIEAVLAFWLAKPFLPNKDAIGFRVGLLPGMALLAFGLAPLPQGPIGKGLFLLCAILCFGLVTWFRILTPGERAFAETFRQV
jgi:O-antigen/teichoic acid export membrane protein